MVTEAGWEAGEAGFLGIATRCYSQLVPAGACQGAVEVRINT